MKAVILPTARTEELAPLTSWFPEFLLPVVNKPIVEHVIELLARHDVREILMILKHMPFETETYFGDGSRWGVHLSYSLLGSYDGIIDALKRIEESRLEDTFLCLPGDVVTDLDISDLIHVHQQGHRDDLCLTQPTAAKGHGGIRPPTAEELRELGACPLIMTRKAFKSMATGGQPNRASLPPESPANTEVGANIYAVPHNMHRVLSPTDLLTVNRLVLEGHFSDILIPGRMMESGVWIGRHCRIHPSARLEAPLVVGSRCNIQHGASVGSGSVIGEQVIIDEGSSVQGSLILSHTYVGAHTEINDSIVRKNCLIQVPSLLNVYLGDDLILGDLEKNTLTSKVERLVNVVLALVLLAMASPVLLALSLYHLVFPSRKAFYAEERFGHFDQENLEGGLVSQPFDLYVFRSRNRLLRKLPGLLNVVKGELNLVGVSPLSEEELSQLPEEWQKIRSGAPLGLFHLWELERRDDLEWVEKMVMDNYYASTRSLWGDMKVLAKGLLTTAF